MASQRRRTFGPQCVIDNARQVSELAIAAISFWAIAMLNRKNRIDPHESIDHWHCSQSETALIEIPVDGASGLQAVDLAGFHADLADRLIVAMAIEGR